MTIDPILRNAAIRAARRFFDAQGLIEVRTDKCVVAGAMEPYIDTLRVSDYHDNHRGFLASSPEFAMKKIFALELRRNQTARGIYEIAAVFRDDPQSSYHLVEFTMVEWYMHRVERSAIIRHAAQLINYVASALGKRTFAHVPTTVDLRHLLMQQGLQFKSTQPYSEFYKEIHGYLPTHANALDAEIVSFNLLFDEIVLPQIKKMPGIVAVEGFPPALAALARVEQGTACRSELFLAGVEIANAYTEEYDPDIMRSRWHDYNTIRQLRGVPEHPLDAELIETAPTLQGVCGIALGLERLLYLLQQN